MTGLGAKSGRDLQARNAQPLMRDLLIEHTQFTPQFAAVALRVLFKASKCLHDLVQLHFRTVDQSVDPLEPKREGDAERDRDAAARADRDPSFGGHGSVALRIKGARPKDVPGLGRAQKETSDRPAQGCADDGSR
jgi:hypothetical protein